MPTEYPTYASFWKELPHLCKEFGWGILPTSKAPLCCNGLMKMVLKWKSDKKRSLDRSKQRRMDEIEKNITKVGIQDGETAQERDKWKQVCVLR